MGTELLGLGGGKRAPAPEAERKDVDVRAAEKSNATCPKHRRRKKRKVNEKKTNNVGEDRHVGGGGAQSSVNSTMYLTRPPRPRVRAEKQENSQERNRTSAHLQRQPTSARKKQLIERGLVSEKEYRPWTGIQGVWGWESHPRYKEPRP